MKPVPSMIERCWTGELVVSRVAEIEMDMNVGALALRRDYWVVEVVVAGEGTPAEVVKTRRLPFVSEDGALIAVIDLALAAQPNALEKIRPEKRQGPGDVIGAVAKAMVCKADAARLRALLLGRAQASM